MCELLGMSCNTPTDLTFSFTGFSSRGGRTGPHGDGWGLAFFEGRASRVFLDPNPCCESPLAAFFRSHSVKTEIAVAHIRKRTHGPVGLANTHPFWREMWGRSWVFAHNGTLPGVESLALDRYNPIGETDSERAFCWMLGQILREFHAYPGPEQLFAAVARLGSELSERGVFNFLLSNGEYLFARCDTKLHHIIRKAPFGRATLADEDVTVDFSRVTTPDDQVAVVATTPLTRDEPWRKGEPGELWVFQRGELVAELSSPVRHESKEHV
jgi:predicted glutamine amidotransferase